MARTARASAVSAVRRRTPHATPSAGHVFGCRRGREPSATFCNLQLRVDPDQKTVTRSRDTWPAGKRRPGPGTRHDGLSAGGRDHRVPSPVACHGEPRCGGIHPSETNTRRPGPHTRRDPLQSHGSAKRSRRGLPGRPGARRSPNGKIRGMLGEKYIRTHHHIPPPSPSFPRLRAGPAAFGELAPERPAARGTAAACHHWRIRPVFTVSTSPPADSRSVTSLPLAGISARRIRARREQSPEIVE